MQKNFTVIRRRRIACFLFLVLFQLAAQSVARAQLRTVSVSGRVVDAAGRPVPEAIVSLYYSAPCDGCIDKLFPTTDTFPDGVFTLDHWKYPVNVGRLYVREPDPQGFFVPFGAPPYRNVAHLPQFRGLPVRLPKDKSYLYVGDVRLMIKYRNVTINLSDAFRGEYSPVSYQPSSIWMTLRDNQGRTVFNGGLPESALDGTHSSVKLALVQGKWTVELSSDAGGRSIQSRKLSIDTASPNVSVR